MTVRLEDQIRAYANNVHETEMPLSVHEITEMRLGTESVRPIGVQAQSVDLRPRQPWLVAVASAAAVVVIVGGATWLTLVTGSDTPLADTVVPTTLAATDIRAPGEDGAASVFGHFDDIGYWEAPSCGPQQCIDEGRMEMSDKRLTGNVTFIHNGAIFGETVGGAYHDFALYWGTMLLENDGGTWEGTHFAADHRSQIGVEGPVVMQLVGSGDYAGLSAILYMTSISPPGTAWVDVEESVDGMIFPGDLPPDRTLSQGGD